MLVIIDLVGLSEDLILSPKWQVWLPDSRLIPFFCFCCPNILPVDVSRKLCQLRPLAICKHFHSVSPVALDIWLEIISDTCFGNDYVLSTSKTVGYRNMTNLLYYSCLNYLLENLANILFSNFIDYSSLGT